MIPAFIGASLMIDASTIIAIGGLFGFAIELVSIILTHGSHVVGAPCPASDPLHQSLPEPMGGRGCQHTILVVSRGADWVDTAAGTLVRRRMPGEPWCFQQVRFCSRSPICSSTREYGAKHRRTMQGAGSSRCTTQHVSDWRHSWIVLRNQDKSRIY